MSRYNYDSMMNLKHGKDQNIIIKFCLIVSQQDKLDCDLLHVLRYTDRRVPSSLPKAPEDYKELCQSQQLLGGWPEDTSMLPGLGRD
jgi:hypothetical protein